MLLVDMDSSHTLWITSCMLNTGPHIIISLTIWTIKWTMISKNEGEKYISGWLKRMIALFSKSSNLVGSITFLQIALMNRQRRVMTYLTFFSRILQITTKRRSCIRTWQSWDFKPISFKFFIEMRLLIFEDYPCGTLTYRKHPQKLIFFRFWQSMTCRWQVRSFTMRLWL